MVKVHCLVDFYFDDEMLGYVADELQDDDENIYTTLEGMSFDELNNYCTRYDFVGSIVDDRDDEDE
jgi:hypothetical protein